MAMKNMALKSGVKHKYHGLVNQGSTCYLNSVLQVLFMTEEFRESVKKTADTTYIDIELRDLFKNLGKKIAVTHKITNRLNIKNVSVPRDAAEHYEKILRLTSPEASQIFHGKLKNRNKCKQCDTENDSPAGFWSLPLPLVDNTEEYSVEKGIEYFFRPSEISGDDQMYCEKCDDKCDAVLDCVVEHHPEVLVLLLKRFEFDYEYTYTYVKNHRCVNVPEMLQTPGNQSYKLYAMVEHFGELQYGHYFSTIKSQDDDTWYTFNDSTVTQCSILPALERSQSAYLLFYRKLKVPQSEMEEIAPRDDRKRPRPDAKSQESVHKKKPKQEPDLYGKVQKCEDLDSGSSSSNTHMFDSQFYPNRQERGERPNPPEPVHYSTGDILSGETLINTKNNYGFRTGERFTQTSEFNPLGREAVGADGSTNQFEDYKTKYAEVEGQGSLQSDDKPKIVQLEESPSETCQQQVKYDMQDILGTEIVGADGSTNQLEDYKSKYAHGDGQGSLQSEDEPKIVQKEEPSSETCQNQVKCDKQEFLRRESECSAGADGSTNQPEKHRHEYAQGESQGSIKSDDKPKIVQMEAPSSETCQHLVKSETQDFVGTEAVSEDGSTNHFEVYRTEYGQGEGQGSLQSDDEHKLVKIEDLASETCKHQFTCEMQDFVERKSECSASADGSKNQPKVYVSRCEQREEQPEEYRPTCAQGEDQGSFESDDKPKIVKIEKPSTKMFQHQVKKKSECSAGADGSTNQTEKNRPTYEQVEDQGSFESDDKSKIVKLCGSSDDGCDNGRCEGSGLHRTAEQEQNIDLADTTQPAMLLGTEETIKTENDNDTRFQSRYLGSGGISLDQQTDSSAEIVKLEVFNCVEEKNSRESGCKNADENKWVSCTDAYSHDSDLKSNPKESIISAEREKEEEVGSNCTDNDIARFDCSTSVNQNDTKPERPEETDFQNMSKAKSKAGVKPRLTIYNDLYKDCVKANRAGARKIQSKVVERKGDEEILRVTLEKSK